MSPASSCPSTAATRSHDIGSALRVVVAPDSFKGSLTASEVAELIADAWRAVRPEDQIVLAPQADGGEGTLDALATFYPDAAWGPPDRSAGRTAAPP
jgi:glycerate kinase